jgi:hypothetical protein
MKLKFIVALLASLVSVGISTQAHAGYQYAGNWEVNSGPSWGNQPLAYTGQQAAALLFGGSAGDYVISTIGADTSLINFLSWYSILGFSGPNNGGIALAQDYVSLSSTQAPGYYYSGNSYSFDGSDAASAYVADNAGRGNVNYAFRIVNDVPEPGTLFLLGLGLTGALIMRRRKH